MKKCNSCQSMQKDSNKFCTQCGSAEFSPIDKQYLHMNLDTEKKNLLAFLKNNSILVAIAAAVVILVVTATTVLFNPLNQIMYDIKRDNFSAAADIYQTKIIDDVDKNRKTYSKVSTYAKELLEQYKKQEISYDDLSTKLNGINSIQILRKEIGYIYMEADQIRFLRETYSSAETEFEKGNYEEAINLYGQVAYTDFENSEDAVEKYNQSIKAFRDDVMSSVQGYIDSGEYSSALYLLDDALDTLPEDTELLSAQQSCMQAEYDDNIQNLLEETEVYKKNKDYVEALDFLESCISTYPEEALLQKEKTDCLAEFEAYVIEESLKLAKEGNYQNALSLTESGLNYFTSTKVTELSTIYASYIPVILGEMEMFQNNTQGGMWVSKTDETNKYLEDNYGNVYENSLSVGHGSVTYLVNFKYQTFSGTVAFPKGVESDGARESATLTIYGDGQKIKEFIKVNEATKPEAFSLDVSSYERITLEWSCAGMNIWEDWGFFATIFDGMLVPIPIELQEDI